LEIAIGPAIEPVADSGGKRIVHGGMAQMALDAHRPKIPALVEESCDTDDRIELQKGERWSLGRLG